MGRPRVAIGGVHIESSTFSAHRSGPADFHVTRGDELVARYELPQTADWIPLVHARALPGGAVEPEFYNTIKAELLERLAAAGPIDGLFLDIHGAMSVVGMRDAEADLAQSIRGVIGDRPLVSAAMDPHGNMSHELATTLDLATSHRMSPHEDAPLTKRRAIANLLRCLERGERPLRAWVRVPVLLPGERACTRDEPARSIYGGLPVSETRAGVIDASVWIGYAWADEPRCGAAVLVTGTDPDAIVGEARSIARRYWDARAAFDFSVEAADAATCLDRALASTDRPFFISDSGDNPTAGGSGDVAAMLETLLAHPSFSRDATAIWASVVAPDAVARCVAAGEGGSVDVRVGGALGSRAGRDVALRGIVRRIARGDPVGGDIAVVAAGGIRAVLTTRRKPFHFIADFTALGLQPAACDATIVKIGYLVPDLFAAARGWMIALTPGGVDQHIERLGHQHVARPIFPLDRDMPTPNLEPTLL